MRHSLDLPGDPDTYQEGILTLTKLYQHPLASIELLSPNCSLLALSGHYNAYQDYSGNHCPNQKLLSPTDVSGCHLVCLDNINFLFPAQACLSRTIIINSWVFFQLETSCRSIHSNISKHEPSPSCVHAKLMVSQNGILGTTLNPNPPEGAQCRHTRAV